MFYLGIVFRSVRYGEQRYIDDSIMNVKTLRSDTIRWHGKVSFFFFSSVLWETRWGNFLCLTTTAALSSWNGKCIESVGVTCAYRTSSNQLETTVRGERDAESRRGRETQKEKNCDKPARYHTWKLPCPLKLSFNSF